MLEIKQMLLDPNPYSRPQRKIEKVKGIVIHWVANPNTSALANRNYFNNLPSINEKNKKEGNAEVYASAHYIIGLEGEIIQCIPDSEMAYHAGSNTYTQNALNRLSSYPNNCTIAIECCHIDWDGRMTDKTYASLVRLAAHKLKQYNLTVEDLWRHYDIVGWKDCHRWFVRNPSEWTKFKSDVAQMMESISPVFKDIPKKYEWAEPDIAVAVARGLMRGRSLLDFAPGESLTRAEAAVLANNIVNYILKQINKA